MKLLRSNRGSTLLIVVIFLALLTILVLGFLARATLELQISDNSTNIVISESYGRGTIDQIIAALKEEIVAGSQVSAGGIQVSPLMSGNSTLYRPIVPATSVPYNSGPSSPTSSYWSTFPNLVKESIHGVPFYPSTNYDSNGSSLLSAAAVSTTSESSRLANGSVSGASVSGSFVSVAEWNEHLLLPKASVTVSGGTNGTPVSISDSGGMAPTPNSSFIAPDWILTAADGSNPTIFVQATMTNPQLSSFIVGRYAYAIYNEGGLLDANVAGSPAATAIAFQPTGGNSSTLEQSTFLSRKGPTSFADLTQLPGIANASSQSPQSVVDQIVGWRNYASAQPSGTFPGYSLSGSINNYFTFVQCLSTQSMENGATSLFQDQSDHFFTSRKQLISFMENLSSSSQTQAYLQDALMYLGTFSRSLNRPSYWPDPNPSRPLVSGAGFPEDGSVAPAGNNAYQKDSPFISSTSSAGSFNPPFENIRVSQGFVRNDGTMASAGDPLVSKRFALSRLAWITYEGPISAVPNGDPLFTQYQNLGIPPSQIAQWTTEGNPANIKKFFGLTWNVGPAGNNQAGGYWVYDPDGDEHSSSMMIKTLDQVAAEERDPTFFELLKASITAGSIAKGGLPALEQGVGNPDFNYLAYRDTRVDYQIFQIGANILNQASPANYPIQVVVYDNFSTIRGNQSFAGITDLPYLYETINQIFEISPPSPVPSSTAVSPQLTLTNPGMGVALQIPIIWNPHSPGANAYVTGLTPTKFRIGVSDAVWPTISSVTPPVGYYSVYPSYDNATAVLLNPPNATPTYSPYDAAPFNTLLSPWGNPHGYPTGPFPTSGTWTSSSGYGTTVSPLVINPVSTTDSYATSTGWLDFSPATKAGVYNTEIYFDGDAVGNTTLYREPTPLMYSTGSSASASGTYLDGNNILEAVGGFSKPYISDYFNSATLKYLGFFEAEFPLCWNYTDTAVTPNTTTTYSVNTLGGSNTNSMGITYSLEYQVGSVWIPYQQNNLYGEQDSPFGGGTGVTIVAIPAATAGVNFWSSGPSTHTSSGTGTVTWDPRSLRWAGSNGVGIGQFLTAAPNVTMQTARPSTGTGQTLHGWCVGAMSKDQDISAARSPIVVSSYSNSLGYLPDADLVVRRPMGAYVPSLSTAAATTTAGLPLATVYPSSSSKTTQNGSNRPIILHRPFRSVAELGYVFSDTPWKNLDFFTPESGFGALLDVFCINEDIQPNALVAGRVDLNTKQTPVIQALLAGAYRDETDPNQTSINNLSTSEATTIAQALVKRTSGNSTVAGGTAPTGPLSNIADLVGRYTSTASVTPNNPGIGVPYDGFSNDLSVYTGGSGSITATSVYNTVERFRETTMRALSDAGQAGTWNLLIDVVAQTGRYPTTATNLAQFAVRGERHYWVHVAIDRSTGQVIDENIEVVNQ